MNRGGSDNRFRSQLTEKRAWKVICSHKNRLLTKNGLIAINSRTVAKLELVGIALKPGPLVNLQPLEAQHYIS